MRNERLHKLQRIAKVEAHDAPSLNFNVDIDLSCVEAAMNPSIENVGIGDIVLAKVQNIHGKALSIICVTMCQTDDPQHRLSPA